MHDDPYEVLGVSPDAQQREIRAAYRRLMRSTHPDLRPGDEEAMQRARNLNAAWELLKDAERRAAHDRRRRPAAGSSPQMSTRAAAYSQERRKYSLAFTLAMLKAALALVAVGLVLIGIFTT